MSEWVSEWVSKWVSESKTKNVPFYGTRQKLQYLHSFDSLFLRICKFHGYTVGKCAFVALHQVGVNIWWHVEFEGQSFSRGYDPVEEDAIGGWGIFVDHTHRNIRPVDITTIFTGAKQFGWNRYESVIASFFYLYS